MADLQPLTILCLASYEKGADFMRACKQAGCRVLLLTGANLAEAGWPRDALDDIFYVPDMYHRQDVIAGVSYLARTERIDRIVALDDFDVEMAAALREHLRVPGMGESTARYFRDKLAMRLKAQQAGIRVPAFAHVLHHGRLRAWTARVPPPWVLKPRSQASSIGIKKIASADELWPALDALGDQQSFYLLEQYVPGGVYHVDSLVARREVVFAEAHGYVRPLLDVYHGGGVFASRTLPRDSEDARTLRELNRALLRAFGLDHGASHTEFIKGDDGAFYFLETSARVGGAYIVNMVEAATGINLWREWARIEIAGDEQPYMLPPRRHDYGGLVLCLARQEHPDTSAYQDPEIVARLDKPYHAGLVLAASDPARIESLLHDYICRFSEDFLSVLPAPDKPTA